MTSAQSLQLISKIISIAIIIQTFEYLSLKNTFLETGIWKWSEIKKDHTLLSKLDLLLCDKNFISLLWSRLLFAFLFFYFSSSFILIFSLFISTLLISLRFRGSFNGGSDYMALIILSALCIAHFSPSSTVQKGALYYIAFQIATSYFLAGFVKLKQKNWRNGKALLAFIESPNYNPPTFFKKIIKIKKLGFLASWAVIFFEIFFPLIFMQNKYGALIWISLALSFHFINVILFGLNRFFIIWAASYPALYFVVNNFSNSP